MSRVLSVESNGYAMNLLFILSIGAPRFSVSSVVVGGFSDPGYDFMKKLA